MEPWYSSVSRGMAEGFNVADHLTWEYGAYPTSCPEPAQTGMMDLAYERVMDTFFFMYC
jgi:hypothetical protein